MRRISEPGGDFSASPEYADLLGYAAAVNAEQDQQDVYITFRVDVERSLKEACAVETVLPEWQAPDEELAELEAAAAASSQRLAGKATARKLKPSAKPVWRQRIALDHAIAEEQERYKTALTHLQEQLSFIHGIESGLCCVPSRSRTLERAAVYAEWRKAERYLWECERP